MIYSILFKNKCNCTYNVYVMKQLTLSMPTDNRMDGVEGLVIVKIVLHSFQSDSSAQDLETNVHDGFNVKTLT